MYQLGFESGVVETVQQLFISKNEHVVRIIEKFETFNLGWDFKKFHMLFNADSQLNKDQSTLTAKQIEKNREKLGKLKNILQPNKIFK